MFVVGLFGSTLVLLITFVEDAETLLAGRTRTTAKLGHRRLLATHVNSPIQPGASLGNRVRIVVATSVMLTFISYWRAAAIVLNDLASSAFYACGIAEQAVGKSAPWFIVGVMLFSFTVRAVYVESCSMFVRGGVYKVVKEALGGTLAKLSVSALMFDYVLTGPISGVSAGQYIVGLINEVMITADKHGWIPRAVHNIFNGTPQFDVNWTSVVFALAVTIYYWWENIKGIHESSEKALWVMQITTVMVVALLGWSAFTLFKVGYQHVPLPTPGKSALHERVARIPPSQLPRSESGPEVRNSRSHDRLRPLGARHERRRIARPGQS